MRLVVIAHNIRSAYNVGAIFRSADGFGAEKIFLTGYSPVPYDEKRIYQTAPQKMIAKTALGAEKQLTWEQVEDIFEVIQRLRKEKFQIVALEQTEKSVDYRYYNAVNKVAIIAGNEPEGIEAEVLKQCDAAIEIPMRGMKNSLNVAVALGVAGYALYNEEDNK